MKVQKAALLEFYDKRRTWPTATGSPVSAITGVIGEDLVLGLLCRHLDGKILSYGCKPGGSSGRRLDAWVSAGRKLYQVEVKNWCAHSMGGQTVPDDTSGIRKIAERNLMGFLTHPRNLESNMEDSRPNEATCFCGKRRSYSHSCALGTCSLVESASEFASFLVQL